MTENNNNQRADDNVIFIGGKPFMNYVTAVVMQFTTNNAPEVDIKARGKFISKAVDVAEVASKRFLKDQNISVKNIKIDSEEFENKEGRKVNVSTLDITLAKKQA
jgi:archaea-specific DNA-binding protein